MRRAKRLSKKVMPAGALLLVIGLAGCRTVSSTAGPTALLFPTAFPGHILHHCRAYPVEEGDVSSWLGKAGYRRLGWVPGVRGEQRDVVARGLSHRGYAELDGRPCGHSLQWISLRFEEAEVEGVCLMVTGGFLDTPPESVRRGLDLGADPVVWSGPGPDGRIRTVSRWGGRNRHGAVRVQRIEREAGVLWTTEQVLATKPRGGPKSDVNPEP